MTYETPRALRMALERRLQARSDETADHGLRARSCDAATSLVGRLWADMFPVGGS